MPRVLGNTQNGGTSGTSQRSWGSASIKAVYKVGSSLLSRGHPQLRMVDQNNKNPRRKHNNSEKERRGGSQGSLWPEHAKLHSPWMWTPEEATAITWSLGEFGTENPYI